jgi:primosomal protein DnaI
VHASCPYQKQENQRSAHLDSYLICDFPKPYLYINLWDVDISKENKSYTEAMMKAMGIIAQNQSKGLYIWGVPGVGKTYLLAGMCNQLAKQGKSICFVNVPKLVGDLKQMFQDNSAMEQYLRRIIRCDVLVLDDIGSESVTAWSRDEIILMILDQRMEQHKLTCFTSNYSMKELYDKYTYANGKYTEKVAADRILERIKVLTCEIFIKGDSRRK